MSSRNVYRYEFTHNKGGTYVTSLGLEEAKAELIRAYPRYKLASIVKIN